MENSLKLQMDVKNNAEDLQRYMLDLQNWEKEMKQKETKLKAQINKLSQDIPPPRNKIKRNITLKDDEKKFPNKEKKQKKICAYDYSSWDKYDADKACAELDEEPEAKPELQQPNTPENEDDKEKNEKEEEEEEEREVEGSKNNLKNLDEAFYEKELGNQFVRKEKWEEAIKCYTRAIELDSRNAIYYANRALCFIKLKNFRSAEVDSTVAIQLDKTYVKAYQRRAFARLALNQIEEALSDYREIVKLEPNNTHAISEISKIEKRLKSQLSNVKEARTEKKIFDPKSIFKTETKKEAVSKPRMNQSANEKKDEEKKGVQGKVAEVKPVKETSGPDTVKEAKKVEEVKVEKSTVKEVDDVFDKVPDGFTIVKSVYVPPHLRSKKPLRRISVKDVVSDSETFNEFIRICNNMSQESLKEEKKPENSVPTITKAEHQDEEEIKNFPKPETFLQFQHSWKIIRKNPEHALKYLKTTTPKTLYKILRHNLESDLFTELLSVLSSSSEADGEFAYSVLCELTGVDRFGSLVLFFSQSDRDNLTACIDSMKSTKTEREIQDLREFYRLGDP